MCSKQGIRCGHNSNRCFHMWELGFESLFATSAFSFVSFIVVTCVFKLSNFLPYFVLLFGRAVGCGVLFFFLHIFI